MDFFSFVLTIFKPREAFMQSVQQVLNELFSTSEKSEKNSHLLMALSPRFLSYLMQIETCCMMRPLDSLSLESRITFAFTKSFTSNCSDDEILNYLRHDFLKPGGYFYDLALNFQHVFIITGLTTDSKNWGGECISSEWGTYQMALVEK
jgi:hypothetical protein